MLETRPANPLTDDELHRWETEGYHVARGLWTAEEVAACKALFEAFAKAGEAVPEMWEPELGSADPLKRYPRVLHPHRWMDLAERMLLDERVGAVLWWLMGEEPLATQSMYYFKPPGGKGQALHQDNYYLKVRPKTCVAAWTAIDRSHPENGGLWVCPGTHTMEVKCPELANPEESFCTDFVAPPAGVTPVPVELEPGDVLFFNGSVVHGSRPNTSRDEWRRSFICHYAPESMTGMSDHYRPVLRFNGEERDYETVVGGGPCGTPFESGLPNTFEERYALGMTPVAGGSIPG
ncbi:MAG: phytanoyl-CoA dioxygenase family protein [Planctomycetota bacterium]